MVHLSILIKNTQWWLKISLSERPRCVKHFKYAANCLSNYWIHFHSHFRYEVLKGIVDYCYTGSLVVNGDNSLELISIANMFEFEGIKEHCSTYLKQVRGISSLYPLEGFQRVLQIVFLSPADCNLLMNKMLENQFYAQNQRHKLKQLRIRRKNKFCDFYLFFLWLFFMWKYFHYILIILRFEIIL